MMVNKHYYKSINQQKLKNGVLTMTMVNLSEAFQQCEYPFYKDITMEKGLSCTLYSVSSPYVSNLSLPYMNFEDTVHMLSLEIIKLRCYEWSHA